MNEIKTPPDLILRYASMNRNEVTLHMTIRALAEGGKLKRNISRLSQMLGKTRYRLRQAEYKLKRMQLLYIHYTRNGIKDVPYWYVYDCPVGSEPAVIVKTEDFIEETPKQKSIWRKLRDAVVGTELTDFSLTVKGDES